VPDDSAPDGPLADDGVLDGSAPSEQDRRRTRATVGLAVVLLLVALAVILGCCGWFSRTISNRSAAVLWL
jgi:hypothetical protein